MNLLNGTFKYVPANKVATEGVLARWLKARQEEREAKEKLEREKVFSSKVADQS